VTISAVNNGTARTDEIELKNADGIILGERENLAPGISGEFTLTLQPGRYVVLCTFQNEQRDDAGTLTVTGSAVAARGPSSAELDAAVEEYKEYVQDEADELLADTREFVAALKAGELQHAKDLFGTTRMHYETIEPIAESFGDLDPLIDARQGDVPDGQWTGFHRIEQELFVDNSTAGMAPVADQLMQNVQKLQARIPTITLEPAQIANGAVELLNEVSASKITGEEDRYSHTDLSDFHGNVAGAQAAFEAVQPLLAKNDAALSSTIDQRFTDVFDALDAYKDPASIANGYALYSALDQTDTRNLSVKVDALAEPLSQVAAIVIQ
jgi:iron uptake system component EfeO